MNPPHKLPPGEAAFNALYYKYGYYAAKRNLEWNIPKDHFRYLTKQNCHYCGIEPKQSTEGQLGKGRRNGDYIYNGVDRKHNDKGYTIDNCVTCCKTCNRMKSALDYDEFKQHIIRIFRYRLNRKDDTASRTDETS